jgi:hypothetical protein
MMSRATHLRRRRYARWALVSFFAFLSLLALVLLAPAMVASGWLWPRVLARLTADYDATVTTQQVSLGWFSPVVLQGVEVVDSSGKKAVEIETVRTEATLLSLLWNSHDQGTVVLEQPTVTLEVRDGQTNLEQILARWLAQPSTGASANLTVQVKDGALDVTDSSQTRVARMESMQITVELPAGGAESGTVELRSCPLIVNDRSGTCAVRCTWTGESIQRNWSLHLTTRDAGLSLVSLVARRFGTDVQADGALNAELKCTWDAATSVLTVNAPLAQLAPLHLAAPAWLGQDTLRWKSLKLAGQAVLGNGRLRFSQVDTACDAGKFTLNGEIPWRPTAAGGAWNDLLTSAAAATIELDGRVDLANLASSFPRLLRIREGVTVESGNVRVVLASNQTAAERRWTAHLETADLVAVAEGRRLTWDEPLQVDLVASQSDTDWQMQKLTCRSSFLQLSGRGDPRSGAYTLTCDLDRLTSELRPVFDFGGLRASGKLGGQLNWRRDDQRIVADASSTIERLELVTPSGATWREPRLQSNWTLEGEVGANEVTVLRGGHGDIVAGDDHLEVDLLEPVTSPSFGSSWVVGLALRGQTSTWLARLQPWWPFTGIEGSGALQIDSTIAMSAQVWDIRKLTARAEPLRIQGPALQIDEPKVLATLTGQWDTVRQRGTIADGTWQSSALGLRATSVTVALNGKRPELAGDVTFRADLQRLHEAWSATATERGWRVAGTAQGQVSLVQNAERTQARWTVDMSDTELSQRLSTVGPRVANAIPALPSATWHAVWKEPALQWTGAGWHDATRDLLQLDRCELVAGTQLTISVAGRVAEPAGRCDVDVQGHVRYDLAQLLPRIVATSSVRASGQEMQEFWLRGPLFHPAVSAIQPAAYSSPTPLGRLPAELCGLANLSWNSADMWGVPIGPGQLRARLEAGKVATDPLEIPLSGGTLRVAPQLDLNVTPAMLTCTPSQVLSDITITPAMCQNWLKYLTPLAAEATRAEGKFGVKVQDAAIPLTQLADARIQGMLLVDSARLGPGPLSLQILQVVEQVRALLERRVPSANTNAQTTWVTIPRQEAQFRLEQGRVAHNRLDMLVGDTPIRTSGSVGLDQSLALVVHLTVQESWVAKDPRLALLKGTQLSIPVGGTLNQPKLDPRALEQLSAQVLQQSANRLIDEGIQRGLQELLGPRKK